MSSNVWKRKPIYGPSPDRRTMVRYSDTSWPTPTQNCHASRIGRAKSSGRARIPAPHRSSCISDSTVLPQHAHSLGLLKTTVSTSQTECSNAVGFCSDMARIAVTDGMDENVARLENRAKKWLSPTLRRRIYSTVRSNLLTPSSSEVQQNSAKRFSRHRRTSQRHWTGRRWG